MKMEIKHYTKDRISDVLRFERDLRAEENFWGWEIDEKYIADVTASFENPTFANSLSLLAYMNPGCALCEAKRPEYLSVRSVYVTAFRTGDFIPCTASRLSY